MNIRAELGQYFVQTNIQKIWIIQWGGLWTILTPPLWEHKLGPITITFKEPHKHQCIAFSYNLANLQYSELTKSLKEKSGW